MTSAHPILAGSSKVWPTALASLSVIFWGASFAATKIALAQFSPATLVFARTSIGILVLMLAAGLTRGVNQAPSIPARKLMVLGLIGVAFHQWIQAQGLRTTSTTDTGWIIATIPIFVAILGWRFLGERMPPLRIGGIALGALGVLLVVSRGQPLAFASSLAGQLGNAYIMISAGNWAIFTVLSKRWLFRRDLPGGGEPAAMIGAMLRLMLIGWALLVPWVLGENAGGALPVVSSSTLGAMLFLGVACSGLAYIFWFVALTRLDATETSALLYFEPLVTQAVAWFYLSEPLSYGTLAGGAAILLGVWMAGRR